ncbi:penicillin-binding protein activator [bacterium]|nr:penicillin-binding protein activator [bacterium]
MIDNKLIHIRIWLVCILFFAIFVMAGFGCGAGKDIRMPSIRGGQDLFAAAEQLYEKRRFQQAEALYKRYLDSFPAPSLADNALFRLGEIAMESGDYSRSLEFFQRISANYPGSEIIPSARFYAIRSLFLNSSWDDALNAIAKFQKEFPATQYDPQVRFILSEIYIKTKEYQKAKEAALDLIKIHPQSSLKDSALYQLGLSEMYLGETVQAIGHLKLALAADLDEDQRQNVLYTLGTLYLMKGDLRLAVDKFSDMVRSPGIGERKDRIAQKIENLFKDRFTDEEIMDIIRAHPDDFPGDLALLEMGERLFKRKEFFEARRYWGLFLSNFPDHPKVPNIKKSMTLFKEGSELGCTGKFGCIAPLSGPLAEYGEKMVKGVKMAIDEYNQRYGTSVKVVLFDSQAKQDNAQKGVELLAYQEKVSAIIGPLLTSTAMSAASVAERIGIPLFTPTASGEGLPESGRFIFRNCLTNQHQAEELANYAIEEKGLTNFGIFFPFNPYGQGMMTAFSDRVEELGGNINIIEFYDPEDTDFKDQIIRINQAMPEALFLPGSYEKIVLIAPQIRFYEPEEPDPNDPNHAVMNITDSTVFADYDSYPDFVEITSGYDEDGGSDEDKTEDSGPKVEAVQLLGTDGWYDERVVKEGESYVDGSIISVGFYQDSADHRIRAFSSNFRARYGHPPDLVSAQAYDATNMLLEASDGATATWDTIRERLSQIRDFPGVTGKTTILPSGDSKKEITLLQIKGKRFVHLDRSPFNPKSGPFFLEN